VAVGEGRGAEKRIFHARFLRRRPGDDFKADFLSVALTPSFMTAVGDQAAVPEPHIEFTNPCCVRDPSIQHIMLALEAEVKSGYPTGRLYGEGLATTLAVHLLRYYSVSRLKIDEHRGGLPPARLRRALDYITATSAPTPASIHWLNSRSLARTICHGLQSEHGFAALARSAIVWL
jgi:hypothetical protein